MLFNVSVCSGISSLLSLSPSTFAVRYVYLLMVMHVGLLYVCVLILISSSLERWTCDAWEQLIFSSARDFGLFQGLDINLRYWNRRRITVGCTLVLYLPLGCYASLDVVL